jgi:hypothetical protein
MMGQIMTVQRKSKRIRLGLRKAGRRESQEKFKRDTSMSSMAAENNQCGKHTNTITCNAGAATPSGAVPPLSVPIINSMTRLALHQAD